MNVQKKPRSSLGTPRVFLFLISAFFAVSAVKQHAQMAAGPATAGYKQEPGIVSTALPAALREIGFDQNIDQRVPLDTTFRDEAGATVRLGDYFRTKPVVMVFAYYDCPMLCTQVINGLSSALGVMSLNPGQGFQIVHVRLN